MDKDSGCDCEWCRKGRIFILNKGLLPHETRYTREVSNMNWESVNEQNTEMEVYQCPYCFNTGMVPE